MTTVQYNGEVKENVAQLLLPNRGALYRGAFLHGRYSFLFRKRSRHAS